MTTTIAPEAMARYRQTARKRELAQAQAGERRRQEAWTVARRAARLLKETFDAKRVTAFGSLAHGAWFSARSDIDLAAAGIPPEAFWRAWAALDRLEPNFEIDLVALEEASERLLEEITRYGVEL
jgi:predicted nucleotidyltransferase